jgi:HSP20 family protein
MNLLKTMTQLIKPEEKSAPAANSETSQITFVTPLANILDTKDGYILEAEMPGVSKEGVEVFIDNGQLILIGHRRVPQPKGEVVYRESRDHDYRRVFEIEPSIDSEKISAKVEQGVLTLHLPKTEAVKPRKISVGD